MIYNCDDLALQVLDVGLYAHTDGFFAVKPRPHAALSYRLSGSGSFVIGGKRMLIEQGDILFLPADMAYEVEYSVSQSIVIHLLACSYTVPEHITIGDKGRMEARFLRILNAWQTHHSVNQVKAGVFDILSHLESDTLGMPMDEDIRQCVRYMEAHYDEADMTVARICEENHISPSGLQRKCQRVLGMNAKQYMTKLRMNKALDMLTAGTHSVKQVAYACGFEDEKYFSRVCKQTLGCAPSQLIHRSMT